MILEIYTERDVSKIDKERCILGYKSDQFGNYTIVNKYYVVYKNIAITDVYQVCNLLNKFHVP